MKKLSVELLKWYQSNKRDLPWRRTNDAYKIWLSEIILQQTRVDQGLEYYLRFIERFPDVKSLADANEDEVLKLWQGLGYYTRARNLHQTSKTISENFNGSFPEDYHELIKLKGVGDYTASAIASIAFSKPFAVVDGNVIRFISRLFGVKKDYKSSEGLMEIKVKANQLIDKNNPGDFNQAIMEFGARVCKPKNPLCTDCIFSYSCYAFNNNIVEELPVKYSKQKQRNRWFHYLVMVDEKDNFVLQKRLKKDIWRNLYEFPLIEVDRQISFEELIKSEIWPVEFPKGSFTILQKDIYYRHKLSHQNLQISFHILKQDGFSAGIREKYVICSPDMLKQYPSSKLIFSFIENNLKKVLSGWV
jgi:A/G-specific adenine glycosylase